MALSSSNLRELKNLVDTLLKMEAEGRLKGAEIFVFTDNLTAERTFLKEVLRVDHSTIWCWS